MKRSSAYGVGMCPTATGAVIAVVRDEPLRLAAVAEVAADRPDDWRALAQARRRLRLPRWCPVSVVSGHSTGLGGAATLARAGMVHEATVGPGQLWMDSSDLIVDERFATALRDPAHQWAVAAAQAAARPAALVPSGRPPVAASAVRVTGRAPVIAVRSRIPTGGDDYGSDDREWGWALERIGR
jgi:hypothetical protein